MKKILLLSFLFTFLFSNVNAETGNLDQVKLSTDETNISIGQNFSLNLSIPITNQADIGDISVVGLEKFQNFGTSSSFKYENINGSQKGSYDMHINLKPTDFGKFIIGPASIKVGDKILKSNTVEIEVTGVNSNGNPKMATGVLTNTGNLEMKDINDIKGPKSFFNFSFWFIPIFLVFLFFIGFYYLLKYYFMGKEEKNMNKEVEIKREKSKTDYFKDKLKHIEKNIETYDKSEFFALINDFLREFLEYKGLNHARNMTFKELESHKNLIDLDLFRIIKDTYFYEFMEEEDEGKIDKKEILSEIKKLIK
nr:BatD family protein [Candidatus Gracilibacteria bacterium]